HAPRGLPRPPGSSRRDAHASARGGGALEDRPARRARGPTPELAPGARGARRALRPPHAPRSARPPPGARLPPLGPLSLPHGRAAHRPVGLPSLPRARGAVRLALRRLAAAPVGDEDPAMARARP